MPRTRAQCIVLKQWCSSYVHREVLAEETELKPKMNLQSSFTFEDPEEPGAQESALQNVEYYFSSGTSEVIRRVITHSGECIESSIENLSRCTDAADAFEQSWIRSKARPENSDVRGAVQVADLFSGCGGMSLGLWEACRGAGLKFVPVFASESDPVKAQVYKENFSPRHFSVGPIEQILNGEIGDPVTPEERRLREDLGSIDVLIGGPPCQGHSDLNNHTRRRDPRNLLVSRMARFCEIFLPRLVMIENVQGINRDKFGALNHTRETLLFLGYDVRDTLVDCRNQGVPQARKRHFLIGKRVDKGRSSIAAVHPTSSVRTVEWAISDLLNLEGSDVFNSSANHSAENMRRIKFLFEHDIHDLPNSQRPHCHRYKEHAYNSVYGRMYWDQPSPTITTGFGSTGQGRFVHPLRARTLTPHEAARIQTIPDFFVFGCVGRTQLQKMIGNSVPPVAMARLSIGLLL